MKESLLASLFILGFCFTSHAQQVGWGLGGNIGLYSWYANPADNIASRSAGSALVNVGISPKMWIGGPDFAISPEVGFMFSPFALSIADYKGLGAISFPMMVKIELLGNSNFNPDGKFGFSLGGGVQYNRTELWYVAPGFKNDGGERNYFRTYVVEADFGFGLSGGDGHVYARYGWNNDLSANTLELGIGIDINKPAFDELADPEF